MKESKFAYDQDLFFMTHVKDFDNLHLAATFAGNMAWEFKDQLTEEEKETIYTYCKICRHFMYQVDPNNPYFAGYKET